MQVGDVISWERAFTNEDVRVFSGLTGDIGTHHVIENEQGQLMVHGLLTASLPTKIGGEINFIARNISFEFHRPVMTGDTIKCDVMLVELEELDEKFNLSTSCTCTNQHGKVVLTADAKGIVFK